MYDPFSYTRRRLLGAAAVVRDGGAVLDAGHFEAGSLQGADGGLATGARALHVARQPCCSPCSMAVFAAASAAICAANGVDLREPLKPTVPADCQEITLPWGSVMRDNGVVERRLDVSGAHGDVLTLGALDARTYVLASLATGSLTSYFFLPPICLRGPLRVRAFVCVRWPRTGRPRR